MKKYWWVVPGVIILGIGLYFLWPRGWWSPMGLEKQIIEQKLEKYDFDSLRKRGGRASEIKIVGDADDIELRRGVLQYAQTKIFTFQSNGKTISGTMNIPNPEYSSMKKAVIMIRGYAEKEGYYPGSGSWRMADQLAKEGYATFSIDFLGYGLSDEESEDVLESRFEKVVSVLDLIATVEAIPYIDKSKIGIWAHSNGGQIALSVLEVTGKRYPTVLWAPMTQTFPESVLSTIDEGSPVKGIIEDFEKHYDARRYAFENYLQWINSPVVIMQGTADEWCKVEWQEILQSRMKSLGKDVELIIYPGADHNLSNPPAGGWEKVVGESVQFLGKNSLYL